MNLKWTLKIKIVLLLLVFTSCDPRNTYTDLLTIVNKSEISVCVLDDLDGSVKSKILQPEESYTLLKVSFDDFTDDSPYAKFKNCIERLGGGVLRLYSLDENLQPKDKLAEWTIYDNIEGRHFFNEESLLLKASDSSFLYEWIFTILPEDLEPVSEDER